MRTKQTFRRLQVESGFALIAMIIYPPVQDSICGLLFSSKGECLMKPHYVYIIETRDGDHKVGYTSNMTKRMSAFSKRSHLITSIKCQNKFMALLIEYELIRLFAPFSIDSFREYFALPSYVVSALTKDGFKPSDVFKRGQVARSRHWNSNRIGES